MNFQPNKIFDYPIEMPEELIKKLKDMNVIYKDGEEDYIKNFLTHNSYFRVISDMNIYMKRNNEGKRIFPQEVQFVNIASMYIMSIYARAILFRHIWYIENSFKNIFCFEACKTLWNTRWTERKNYNDDFDFNEIEKQKNLIQEMRKDFQKVYAKRGEIERLKHTMDGTRDTSFKRKLKQEISDIGREIKDLSRKWEKNYFLYVYVRSGYTDPEFPPFWNVMENLTLWTIVKMYKCVVDQKNYIRGAVAKNYKISNKILGSWMQAITNLRNICCHHNKLSGDIATIANDKNLQREFWITDEQKNQIYHLCCIIFHLLLCIEDDKAIGFIEDLKTILSISSDFILNISFPSNREEIFVGYQERFTKGEVNLIWK